MTDKPERKRDVKKPCGDNACREKDKKGKRRRKPGDPVVPKFFERVVVK